MPYSEYAVKDRQAVGQLRYQVRRFIRQMRESGVHPEDQQRISEALNEATIEAAGSVDYYDDGTRMGPAT